MVTELPANPFPLPPAVPAADRAEAWRRHGPQLEAYARYVRLLRLHRAMPASHPDYPALATALVAADARWRTLTAACRLSA